MKIHGKGLLLEYDDIELLDVIIIQCLSSIDTVYAF